MLQKNPNVLSQYEETKAFVLSKIVPMQQTEIVALHNLVGRVLAEDLVSPLNLPAWPQSAMDGYAFSSESKASFLPVVDCIFSGQPPIEIDVNQAVKIMTGGLLPKGLDTVIPFESAMIQQQYKYEILLTPANVMKGRHVKLLGSDVQARQKLLSKGHRLTTKDIGLIASLGIAEVKVFRQVKVAILASGDELLLPGQAYQLGKIYDANSFQIAALCAELPVEIVGCERVVDDLASVSMALETWSQQADVILTLGGASAGQKDFIKTCLSGYKESWFWKLAMKPAKPFAMARKGSGAAWVMALPGNPLAAFMSFQLFVREALKKAAGQSNWLRKVTQETLLAPQSNQTEKVCWVQAVKTTEGVMPLENASASQLTVLSSATGFIGLRHRSDYAVGSLVEYQSYGDCADVI